MIPYLELQLLIQTAMELVFQLGLAGDGCNDTGEAGYTDSTLVADRDGILGMMLLTL